MKPKETDAPKRAKKEVYIAFNADLELTAKIDAYRAEMDLDNRAQAIRRLLLSALDAEQSKAGQK